MTATNTLVWEETRVSEYVLVVSAGNPAHDLGQVSVTIKGDGAVQVERLRDDDRETFQGNVSLETARQVMARAVPSDMWTRRWGERKGVPDEARYSIEVNLGDEALARIEAWEDECDADEGVCALIIELRRIAAEISDSKAIL